ncbi:MAG: redox-sensing transcriptional repressor Rex [Bacillota bacterium]
MRRQEVPGVVIKRLPVYLQVLAEIDAENEPIISSQVLAQRAGINSGQLRKDLSYFGLFGRQGVGYQSGVLLHEIRKILKLDQEKRIALVGAGSLGLALTRYNLQREQADPDYRLKISAIFDNDPKKVGKKIASHIIEHVDGMPDVIKRSGIALAIVTVPAQEAQKIADLCAGAGVKGILNFAPVRLKTPPFVRVHHMDLAAELQSLAYYG